MEMETESYSEAPTSMERRTELVDRWSPELRLRKYLLLVATLFVMVTYSRGFNPPGGVRQDTGEPILRDTNYIRYAVFFYSNAIAFASSLMVVLLLLLSSSMLEKRSFSRSIVPLRVVMLLDLLSLMMAYAAGTSRDTFTTIYSSVMVGTVFLRIIFHLITHGLLGRQRDLQNRDMFERDQANSLRLRKVLMLLTAFMVSATYVAGLSTPGGFWNEEDTSGHFLGDAILQHGRLTAFFVCNTTGFVVALLIILDLLLDRNISSSSRKLYGCLMLALTCLIGAYAAGSCRETGPTAYVVGGCAAAVLVCLLLVRLQVSVPACWRRTHQDQIQSDNPVSLPAEDEEQLDRARFNVVLLATLAATITYQAGLDPPGGVWQDNADDGRYLAGDPILLTASASRYTTFFYCNSVAFVASLVSIVLVQKKLLVHHVLKAAMILDLFGLIGAYAAGSCREVSTSIHVLVLAGAVLSYVVIHITFFMPSSGGHDEDARITEIVERRRKRLLLFAILATTVTYQAGLTPPGGFYLQDDESANGGQRLGLGDPVLLHNNPGRYHAFFYINSASFMLSIALIILLLNPQLYRLAIRCYAMEVCTVAGLLCLMGTYTAGSTQHLSTSISIIVLLALPLVLLVLLLLLILFCLAQRRPMESAGGPQQNRHLSYPLPDFRDEGVEKKMHANRKYLMLLGILVTTATYQAGLHPPGGVWQHAGDGHEAGNPVMHDTRRHRYLAFFSCNSTSFASSIAVIVLLLVQSHKHWEDRVRGRGTWFTLMTTMIVLDLVALLGGYAAGSCRSLKSSAIVVALVVVVLVFFATQLMLSRLSSPQAAGNTPRLTIHVSDRALPECTS